MSFIIILAIFTGSLWEKHTCGYSIGPSAELRKWFGHDPDKWNEFQKKYHQELKNNEGKHKTLTLCPKILIK